MPQQPFSWWFLLFQTDAVSVQVVVPPRAFRKLSTRPSGPTPNSAASWFPVAVESVSAFEVVDREDVRGSRGDRRQERPRTPKRRGGKLMILTSRPSRSP
jgi:hypothetical protein